MTPAELESRVRLGENFDKFLPVPTRGDGKIHIFERGVQSFDSIPALCGRVTFGDRLRVKLLDGGASEASGLIDFSMIDSVRVAAESFAEHLCPHCIAVLLA